MSCSPLTVPADQAGGESEQAVLAQARSCVSVQLPTLFKLLRTKDISVAEVNNLLDDLRADEYSLTADATAQLLEYYAEKGQVEDLRAAYDILVQMKAGQASSSAIPVRNRNKNSLVKAALRSNSAHRTALGLPHSHRGSWNMSSENGRSS